MDTYVEQYWADQLSQSPMEIVNNGSERRIRCALPNGEILWARRNGKHFQYDISVKVRPHDAECIAHFDTRNGNFFNLILEHARLLARHRLKRRKIRYIP